MRAKQAGKMIFEPFLKQCSYKRVQFIHAIMMGTYGYNEDRMSVLKSIDIQTGMDSKNCIQSHKCRFY